MSGGPPPGKITAAAGGIPGVSASRQIAIFHIDVPFHLLKDVPALSCGDPGTGNIILQADNLVGLKAILPYYAGQVKCITIDPPYNTGNEGWAYM